MYRGIAPSSLLGTYEAERLPLIRSLVETTEGATDASTADSPFLHHVVELAAPVALGLGKVQDRAAKVLSQTGTRYADSSLTVRGKSVGDYHAGERLEPAAGQPPLSPDRFSLLATREDFTLPGSLEPWKDLIEVRGLSASADTFPVVALVRPDGHIALATKDIEDVRGWFEKWAAVSGN